MNEAWLDALRESATVSEKNWWVAFSLSLLVGIFGADRFYLGSVGLGFVKLATFGGGLWWWLIDLILLLTGKMKDGEGRFVVPPGRNRAQK
jgi:TM2 domain-containing membrane protein YozV